MEIQHSNILAWLFDPNESHAMGDAFIKEFARKLAEKNERENFDYFAFMLQDFYSYQVYRESNHMDIVLLSREEKTAIIIENKIWSGESEHQLQEYYERSTIILFINRKEFIMKNKIIFACAFLAVSAAALTGCGRTTTSDTEAVDSTTTTSAAETTTIAETTTNAETTTIAEATTTAEETTENKETAAASESETTSEMTTYANGDVPSKPAPPSVAEAKAVMEALTRSMGSAPLSMNMMRAQNSQQRTVMNTQSRPTARMQAPQRSMRTLRNT